ncbi:putative capsid protein [Circular genetic element sp.]|nr:putative capsid protein [Circular genetic element sp.]
MAYGRTFKRSYGSATTMGRRMYSGMRGSRTSRTRRYGSSRGSSRLQRFRPRFATVGFNRDVEKKYNDRALSSINPTAMETGNVNGKVSTKHGIMWTSTDVMPEEFGGRAGSVTATTGDLLKSLMTGTTVTTRIGNKIRARYLKGAITFNCPTVVNSTTSAVNAQNGESIVEASNSTELVQYLRTTFRWCIVKDLQVNSTDMNIN